MVPPLVIVPVGFYKRPDLQRLDKHLIYCFRLIRIETGRLHTHQLAGQQFHLQGYILCNLLLAQPQIVLYYSLSRNMGNDNEIGSWLDNMIASSSPTIAGTLTNSISVTAYLTTSDYICLSIYPLSGAISYYSRNCASITLIQRTAQKSEHQFNLISKL